MANIFERVAAAYGVTAEQAVAIIDDDMLNGDASIKPVGLLSCQPPRPDSAVAAKPSWAVAARAAAASPGPRTSDVAQARSAATTQIGATYASTASSEMDGDVPIAAGDLS